jgi:hypothetical protein
MRRKKEEWMNGGKEIEKIVKGRCCVEIYLKDKSEREEVRESEK